MSSPSARLSSKRGWPVRRFRVPFPVRGFGVGLPQAGDFVNPWSLWRLCDPIPAVTRLGAPGSIDGKQESPALLRAFFCVDGRRCIEFRRYPPAAASVRFPISSRLRVADFAGSPALREPLIWRVFFWGLLRNLPFPAAPVGFRRSGSRKCASFRSETAAGSAPAGPMPANSGHTSPLSLTGAAAFNHQVRDQPGSSASRCTFLSKPRYRTMS